MDVDAEIAKAHEPHDKHLQLGVDPDNLPDRGDPIDPDDDPDAIDALWDDSTDVKTFKADIESLIDERPEVVQALREDRESR